MCEYADAKFVNVLMFLYWLAENIPILPAHLALYEAVDGNRTSMLKKIILCYL